MVCDAFSHSFVSVDSTSGAHAAALFGCQGDGCGVPGAICPPQGCCAPCSNLRPCGEFRFNGAGLAGNDDAGSVALGDINRAVLRILTVMFRIGTMDAGQNTRLNHLPFPIEIMLIDQDRS